MTTTHSSATAQLTLFPLTRENNPPLNPWGRHARSDWPHRAQLLLVFCGLSALLTTGCAGVGCCLTLKSEDQSHVQYTIFGFGRVTLPSNGQTDVIASRATAFGLSFIDSPGMKFSLGYHASRLVIIPRQDANVIVEAKSCGQEGISLVAIFTGETSILASKGDGKWNIK